MQKRRKFTREFKLEAIRLVEESNKPLAQVARELGVRADVMRHWKRQVEGGAGRAPEDIFPGNGRLPTAEDEVRQLRREVELLREERDFLKKAAAYFAKGSR
jgi:transposase